MHAKNKQALLLSENFMQLIRNISIISSDTICLKQAKYA